MRGGVRPQPGADKLLRAVGLRRRRSTCNRPRMERFADPLRPGWTAEAFAWTEASWTLENPVAEDLAKAATRLMDCRLATTVIPDPGRQAADLCCRDASAGNRAHHRFRQRDRHPCQGSGPYIQNVCARLECRHQPRARDGAGNCTSSGRAAWRAHVGGIRSGDHPRIELLRGFAGDLQAVDVLGQRAAIRSTRTERVLRQSLGGAHGWVLA